MTTLYLHVGQAGCQIGQKFWTPLVPDIRENNTLNLALCHQNRRDIKQHRSIFVDTEAKALNDSMSAVGSKRIGPCILFGGKGGRGNCFPMGFNLGFQNCSEDVLDESFDFIRREVERCEYLATFIMTHSLGGGTGSGLGTRMLTWMKDYFPLRNLISVSCLGFINESPIQNYNTVLSVSQIQQLCDAVIVVNNEDLTKSGTVIERSMDSINEEICFSLHGCFLPTQSLNSDVTLKTGSTSVPKPAVSFNSEPAELIRTVAPMPTCNVLHLDSIVVSPTTPTPGAAQSLARAVKRLVREEDRSRLKVIASTVVGRNGIHLDDAGVQRLQSALPYVPWNPFPIDVWKGDNSFCIPYLKKSKQASLTACSNSNRFVPHFRRLCDRSRGLVNVGAFLHWYQKYGCDREDVISAIDSVQQFLANYDDL